jgi:hypothetical protein
MSIGALAISESPFAAQGGTSATSKNAPPKNRTVVANSDAVAQPEPR